MVCSCDLSQLDSRKELWLNKDIEVVYLVLAVEVVAVEAVV